MAVNRKKRTARVRVRRLNQSDDRERRDHVAVEEPLEIRLETDQTGTVEEVPVAVTMRTPGDDFDLSAGFLLSEGILQRGSDIAGIRYCQNVDPQEYNVVTVSLRSGVPFDPESLNRNFYVTSSCGVCGKASLEAVEHLGCAPLTPSWSIPQERLRAVPERLRESQPTFERTGGIHAAGLFSPEGDVWAVREDVGRHNAVDKVLGHAHLTNPNGLLESGLVVSGRTSFEILQKAVVSGVGVVAAVGAPSSLAIDMARRFNVTLTGFHRDDGFNLYAGPERVGLGDSV